MEVGEVFLRIPPTAAGRYVKLNPSPHWGRLYLNELLAAVGGILSYVRTNLGGSY
jgi:hypothetical protein